MYIRRTSIKSRANGEPYYSHRLVESVRTEHGVRQRTLVNLGRHFDVPREQWSALAQRIEHLVTGQGELVPADLDAQFEEHAQRYSALVLHSRARVLDSTPTSITDFQSIDISRVEVLRPRSASVEHVSIEALRQLQLDDKFQALGFTKPQLSAAIGSIVARMVAPGSERFTHAWLQQHSALGELIGHDFQTMSAMQLYRASDLLLKHKETLEHFVYERERSLFELRAVS